MFVLPSDIGRIPQKISSGFSSFTADQWKNWSLYFSVIVLRDILPNDTLECWRHFVLACRLLTSKQINRDQMILADALLLQFCKRTETMFGKKLFTPNMHMHGHLKSCMDDYGPLHGFWLYSFERYNGIISSMPNNNKAIEPQVMRRFLREIHSLSTDLPTEYAEHFSPLFSRNPEVGSMQDTLTCSFGVNQQSFDLGSCCWSIDSPSHLIRHPNFCSRFVLSTVQRDHLIELYSELYATDRHAIEVSSVCMKFTSVSMYGKQLGSCKSRSASSSIVIVHWNNFLFGSAYIKSERVACINFFCKHVAVVNGQEKVHLLADLSWYKIHPESDAIGKPVSIWYYDLFESDGIYSLLPIQFIKSRSASLIDKYNGGETVLYITSIIDF